MAPAAFPPAVLVVLGMILRADIADSKRFALPPKIFFHANYTFFLCITPKIASSEILDFLRFSELGVPAACKFGPGHVPGAEQKCIAYEERFKKEHPDMPQPAGWATVSRYQERMTVVEYLNLLLNANNIKTTENNTLFLKGGSIGQWRALNKVRYIHDVSAKLHLTGRVESTPVVVPFRDPWSRLCSGFRSKFIGKCSMDPECFANTFVPSISTNDIANAANMLELYFDGIVDAATNPNRKSHFVDEHFKLQASTCLGSRTKNMTLVPQQLELHPNMVEFSKLLKLEGNSTFANVMGAEYVWSKDGKHVGSDSTHNPHQANANIPWEKMKSHEVPLHPKSHCYPIKRQTLRNVWTWLKRDYDTILERTGVAYESSGMLQAAFDDGGSDESSPKVVCVINSTIQ